MPISQALHRTALAKAEALYVIENTGRWGRRAVWSVLNRNNCPDSVQGLADSCSRAQGASPKDASGKPQTQTLIPMVL
jgi:hypothetical protein